MITKQQRLFAELGHKVVIVGDRRQFITIYVVHSTKILYRTAVKSSYSTPKNYQLSDQLGGARCNASALALL